MGVFEVQDLLEVGGMGSRLAEESRVEKALGAGVAQLIQSQAFSWRLIDGTGENHTTEYVNN